MSVSQCVAFYKMFVGIKKIFKFDEKSKNFRVSYKKLFFITRRKLSVRPRFNDHVPNNKKKVRNFIDSLIRLPIQKALHFYLKHTLHRLQNETYPKNTPLLPTPIRIPNSPYLSNIVYATLSKTYTNQTIKKSYEKTLQLKPQNAHNTPES